MTLCCTEATIFNKRRTHMPLSHLLPSGIKPKDQGSKVSFGLMSRSR
eukprot:CAMPEP_0119081538 /NCGR_PEP_ID=MMETSP1178-20130426/117357_1 /TAXON_ID=33656 /ORGANISM="unid sp, Strain CCMP2000" /LENGTH=46 /DNA_ID= /DNA_START= /DNA_END= /DNA_ORIENTATION=